MKTVRAQRLRKGDLLPEGRATAVLRSPIMGVAVVIEAQGGFGTLRFRWGERVRLRG